MQLVKVHYYPTHNGHVLSNGTLSRLSEELRTIVAHHLSCAEGLLGPDEIEVICTAAGPYDRSELQITISIEAMPYQERLVYQDPICNAIRDKLADIIPGHNSFGVWLTLPPAAWAERGVLHNGFGDMLENPPVGAVDDDPTTLSKSERIREIDDNTSVW